MLKIIIMCLLCASSAIYADPLSDVKEIGITYGEGNAELYVFVSATCPYCKVFHETLRNELVESGFKVVYLFIAPGEDVTDLAYKRATQIYCSKDKEQALNGFSNAVLHAGMEADEDCSMIVDGVNKLSAYYGIRGTPSIVFPDSSTMVGVPQVHQVVSKYISAVATLSP